MSRTNGPLRACERNPRYFADASGAPVYLTGSHTWSNFKDMGRGEEPPRFDFDGYLAFLGRMNHNFIRLWTWELSTFTYEGEPVRVEPFPWVRTGPGETLDGRPAFDLMKLDDAYFERLRARATAARERGIYVSVMLFEGHGLHASLAPWCFDGYPFNVKNNVNGIDGDPERTGRGLATHTLALPGVTKVQEAYVARVVDAVNDLDNVLYEITNESGAYSTEWQYHMIDFVHDRERSMPQQHPVGMTFQFSREDPGTNENLFASPADWISPNPNGGYKDDPPAADGRKVVLSDTDHLWGIGGDRAWAWKSFCRGHNPLFMDPYARPDRAKAETTWTDHLSGGPAAEPKWDALRANLGYTRRYALRMDLAAAAPRGELAGSGYCLAEPGRAYLVYAPEGGTVTLDLGAASGELEVEWCDPGTGEATTSGTVAGGAKRELASPFEGDAVLFVHA
jgi:hypothetical protein